MERLFDAVRDVVACGGSLYLAVMFVATISPRHRIVGAS